MHVNLKEKIKTVTNLYSKRIKLPDLKLGFQIIGHLHLSTKHHKQFLIWICFVMPYSKHIIIYFYAKNGNDPGAIRHYLVTTLTKKKKIGGKRTWISKGT